MILMTSSVLPSSFEASVRDSYLILSRASDELEISSLKKIIPAAVGDDLDDQ